MNPTVQFRLGGRRAAVDPGFLEYVGASSGEAASGSINYTLPPGSQAGDLVILGHVCFNPTGLTLPTDFEIVAYIDSAPRCWIIAGLLTASHISDGFINSGLSGSGGQRGGILVYNPDSAISDIATALPRFEINANAPANQNCDASGETAPLVVVGLYGCNSAVTTRGFSGGSGNEKETDGAASDLAFLKAEFFDAAGGNITLSKIDDGNSNLILSGVVLVNQTPGVRWISSFTGSLNPTTGFTATIPTVAVDDIITLDIVNRGATADPTVVDDDTGGDTWHKAGGQNADTNGAITTWYKRATSASSGKTITVSGLTNSSAGVGNVYRGCIASGSPIEQYTGEANASGNETQVGITPTNDNAMLHFAVGNTANDTNTVSAVQAATSGMFGNYTRHASTGGLDSSVDTCNVPTGKARASGAVTWTQVDGTTASVLFALIPA